MEKNKFVYHCKACFKNIPKSAVITAEGKDYAWHFCGKECFEKWNLEDNRPFSEKEK